MIFSIIAAENRCEATCKSAHYGFIASFGRLVKDGVSCSGKNEEMERVCLHGTCQVCYNLSVWRILWQFLIICSHVCCSVQSLKILTQYSMLQFSSHPVYLFRSVYNSCGSLQKLTCFEMIFEHCLSSDKMLFL